MTDKPVDAGAAGRRARFTVGKPKIVAAKPKESAAKTKSTAPGTKLGPVGKIGNLGARAGFQPRIPKPEVRLNSPATSTVMRTDAVADAATVEQVKLANAQSNNAIQTAVTANRSGHFSPFKFGFFGGLGVLLAYVTFLSLDTLRSTLIVIGIAGLLAIGLEPAVALLGRRGMRRGMAVAAVMLSLLAVLGGAIYAIIPPIINEVSSFIVSIPSLIANLQQNEAVKNLDAKFGLLKQLENSNFLKDLAPGAADGIVSAGVTVAGVFFDIFVILILTLYFLSGFPGIKKAAYKLAPQSKRPRVTELGDVILKQMGGYLGGATLIALQAGLVAGIFASIVGMPYPWAIALGAAVLDFIPVVGPIVVGISMMLIGFTQSLTIGIIAAIFYLCQHLFEAYWLYPRVMKRAVNISTGAVVVAIVLGGALLGVTGALMAVPIAAAVQLIVREVVFPLQDET